jgi:hypothetical protein
MPVGDVTGAQETYRSLSFSCSYHMDSG